MRRIDTVTDFLRTAKGQETFLEWLKSDTTQLLLGAARELARPRMPSTSDAVSVGAALGESVGANMIVDFLSNPQSVAPPAAAPSRDYGARVIIKQGDK